MTKKLIVVAVVACGFFDGSSYWIGREGARRAEAAAEREAQTARQARDELAALAARHHEAEKEIASLRAEMQRRDAEQTVRARGVTAPAEGAPEEAAGKAAETPAASGSGIDWSRLSELIAANLDLLARHRDDEDKLTPEEQSRLMEVHLEMMKVVHGMRKISRQPLFHEQLMPELFEALMGRSLELSDEQRAALGDHLGSLFASKVAGFDFEKALPVEVYGLRQAVLSGMERSVGELLQPEQQDAWGQLRHVLGSFLEGDRALSTLPLRREGDSEKEAQRVAETWRKDWELTEDQSAAAISAAQDFTRRAREVLDEYGQFERPPRNLADDERGTYQAKLLEAQLRAERELRRSLTPEQLGVLRDALPTIFDFHAGGNDSRDIRRGSPF